MTTPAAPALAMANAWKRAATSGARSLAERRRAATALPRWNRRATARARAGPRARRHAESMLAPGQNAGHRAQPTATARLSFAARVATASRSQRCPRATTMASRSTIPMPRIATVRPTRAWAARASSLARSRLIAPKASSAIPIRTSAPRPRPLPRRTTKVAPVAPPERAGAARVSRALFCCSRSSAAALAGAASVDEKPRSNRPPVAPSRLRDRISRPASVRARRTSRGLPLRAVRVRPSG